MLMIVCVHTRVDFRSPAVGILARVHGVCVQNASEFDFKLDGAVLVEDPVNAVFIVGCGKDMAD